MLVLFYTCLFCKMQVDGSVTKCVHKCIPENVFSLLLNTQIFNLIMKTGYWVDF